MKRIENIYNELCKREFGKYGFKRHRTNHYRVVNDVFQSFCLHKSISGRECTVEFVVFPLCTSRVLSRSTCGAYHLKTFEGNYEWFSYDRNSEESMTTCVLEMHGYMKKYLMPYFERENSCISIYNESKIDKGEFYKKIAPSVSYPVALKVGEYDLALKLLATSMNNVQQGYEWNYLASKGNLSPAYTKKVENDIKEIQAIMDMVTKRDIEWIDMIIKSNEQANLENLRQKGT